MFRILLRKELLEQLRTSRFLIMVLILFASGLVSPLLAKYTPVLLRSLPDLPEGLLGAIPEPTIADSIAQYVKNVTQFGVLLVVLFNMGPLAQEKERGTAGMLLVKPVSRTAFVLAKWSAAVLVVLLGMAAAAIAQFFYTYILFDATLDLPGFVFLSILMTLLLVVYLSAAIAASSLAKTQGSAVMFAFAALAMILILSALPRVSDVMPPGMLAWGSAASLGARGEGAWEALAGSILLTAAFIVFACLRFEREEI